MKKKVLVIGGAGYIGSHVVDILQELGHEITIFDNLSSGFKENIDKDSKLIIGDILDIETIDKVFSEGFDVIMHFAALKNVGESMINPEIYSNTNIVGTLNILNAMARHNIKYIIFSSSAAVYGTPKYLPMDELHPVNPESFYGFTKFEIEKFLEWYSKIHGIHFAALRYFNAAGYTRGKCKEKNPGNLLPIIMEVASGMRKELQVYGNDYETVDGSGVRDYIHVIDLADAHIKAMDYIINSNKNIIVNLSTQRGHSVLDLIKRAEQMTGRKITYKIVDRRLGDTATVIASSELAKSILGWQAKNSDINSIISSMWDIYKN
jgi:UDP-glucose 4-epimerase